MLPLKEQEHALASPLQLILMERRSKTRYPLVLQVRYRTLGRRLRLGQGEVVNLSSSGALVDSRHQLELGEELEVQMEWPSLLDGCVPLQLIAIARTVRCGPSSFAVRFRRHQFRTLRRQVQPIATSVFRTPARTLATK
jgi:PilZ domain-containing protein